MWFYYALLFWVAFRLEVNIYGSAAVMEIHENKAVPHGGSTDDITQHSLKKVLEIASTLQN